MIIEPNGKIRKKMDEVIGFYNAVTGVGES